MKYPNFIEKEDKLDKLKVFLVEYNKSFSAYENVYKMEKKIFFNKEKLEKFIKDNILFDLEITLVEVEDVENIFYK